jgi:capsular exopolysaccharide synthesis family protein
VAALRPSERTRALHIPRQVAGKEATVTNLNTGKSNVRYELIAERAPTTEAFDPIAFARRTLRGRWLQACFVAIALGAAGGYAGYSAATPMFESTGLVRVAGALPPILYSSQETQLPPNFDAFVSAQATFLTSRQVLTAALDSPYLSNSAWPMGNDGIVALEETMKVERNRGEQVIAVSVRHEDPILAQAAVNAVLYAFDYGYSDPDHIPLERKEETLIERANTLEKELAETRQAILLESDQYGVDAIEQMHDSTVKQIMAVDQKIAELNLARSALIDGLPAESLSANTPLAPATPTSNALTALRLQEQSIIAELDSWNRKYGPNHPILRELARRLEAVRIEMNLRESVAGQEPTAVVNSQDAIDRLDRLAVRYEEIRTDLKATAATLGGKMVELKGLLERQAETQQRLATTRQRLDELNIEGSRPTNQRVTIAAAADYPIAPVVNRQVGLAAAGSIFGVAVGLILVMIAGATDHRIRYADELTRIADEAPLLSVLPDLAGKIDIAGAMAEAGVHQLRNLIEIQSNDAPATIIAVTSPSRGDGRTSVALGLATSFASAGRRTLLVDADMTAPTLTRQLGVQSKAGLCETISNTGDGGEVHPTSHEGLWVLPAGQTRQVSAEDLSLDRLRWLLNAVRDRFEAIVIDTGSMTDSVEAPVVAAAADRVVLVVSRNQHIRQLRRSLEKLKRIGVTVPGLVFNRASSCDLDGNRLSIVSTGTGRTIRFVDTPTSVGVDTIGRIGGTSDHHDLKQAA